MTQGSKTMKQKTIGPNMGENRMNSLFTKHLEIDKNGASSAAIAGARERNRLRAAAEPLIASATSRPDLSPVRSESVGAVLERRRYMEELAEPSAEYLRLKAAIVKRQAIGDNVAANDNEPFVSFGGIAFGRAA